MVVTSGNSTVCFLLSVYKAYQIKKLQQRYPVYHQETQEPSNGKFDFFFNSELTFQGRERTIEQASGASLFITLEVYFLVWFVVPIKTDEP